jgi:YD repeat-containing protein
MSAEKPYQAMRLLPDGTSWTADYRYSGGLLGELYENYTDDGGNKTGGDMLVNNYSQFYYSETISGNRVNWTGNWLTGIQAPGRDDQLTTGPDSVAFTDHRPYLVTGTYPHFSSMDIQDAANAHTWECFNSRGQLTGVQLPSGLTITNYYNASNFLAKSIALQIQATNLFTYSGGLPATRTDANGLTVNLSWDNLDRLTNVAYPDGTTLQYIYTYLDLTDQKDRLGYWTHAQYDALRRMKWLTDKNGKTTTYSYCDCGGLGGLWIR